MRSFRFPNMQHRLRSYPNYWDGFALLLIFAVLGFLAWSAKQMATPYQLGQSFPIHLDPFYLPLYAGRTVVRMLLALMLSLLFTFIFGTWAAKSRRAEKIIIPMIDVLQSVPILGFLSITITGFIALFPGSLIGPECAAIFAIFTSQAWNMALGFYQTVRSVPSDIREASKMFHLSAWQTFWRIEVPFSMPGLLWNAMLSMSGGWFFLVACEALSVAHQSILLPGIGSYIVVAAAQANLKAIIHAVLTMLFVIIIYDQLLFRPLIAWSEKFKSEQYTSEKVAESWVIDLFRRTRFFRIIGLSIKHSFDKIVNCRIFLSRPPKNIKLNPKKPFLSRAQSDTAWSLFLCALSLFILFSFSRFAIHAFTPQEIFHVFYLGLITGLRVCILLIICTFIWVPVGIWIGLNPNVTKIVQPIAQMLAAFPANLFYPIAIIAISYFSLNPNIWLSPLMVLGAQWYILFNVIAGASCIPKELQLAVDNLGATGWLKWKVLLLPAIFPYFITGAITAAGGAWNASIQAEVANWGQIHLNATGLGAYIVQYTRAGDFPRIVLGVFMMCLFVLTLNRLIWRPLYRFAESRFMME